jgi:uncharacterized membrane protein (UPF0127 family)
MTARGFPCTAPARLALALAAACASALAHPGGARAGAGAPRIAPIAERRPVCIRGACFDSEVAATEAERAQGLMFRDSLARDRGMLFVFPEPGQHRFWMKNTRIELDMVFIGADRRIVGIVRRARPCRADPCETYGPPGEAAYVLEIAGGVAEAGGFAAGDLVEFPGSRPGR